MSLMGYGADWRNFHSTISRAMMAAENQGLDSGSLFVGVTENSGGRPREDVHLSRFAAYLVAMNGDPRKPDVAAAQAYFAIRTREAEMADDRRPVYRVPQTLPEALRLAAEAIEERDTARAVVDALTPLADIATTYLSASGDYSVAEAAKLLSRSECIETGEARLFDWLAAHGWTVRHGGRPAPEQTRVARGHMRVRGTTYVHPRTRETMAGAPQVRITPRGVELIGHAMRREARAITPLTPA
jgi:DNA-damage-inducible protein D